MPRATLALLAVAGVVGAVACGLFERRPDVVVIVLDTLRADHVSAYGYARRTTPRIDALAAEGVLYRRAIAPGTWTVPSHAGLFTGRPPVEHGAYRVPDAPHAVSSLNAGVETLAERLGAAGYDTAAFVGNETYLDPSFGMARGFELYRTDDTRPGERLANRVTRWIRRRARRPAFLFVNFLDVHEPYRAHPPYDTRFPGKLPEDPGDVTARFAATGELPAPAVLTHCISQYDGDVAYVDAQLARILDELAKHGRYDNALIVVTSDHGDLFGEHGRLGHGGIPWDALVHVPLVIRYPRGAHRGVEDRVVSLVDVAPTVLAVLGLPPLAGAPGRPLWAPSRPVVAEEMNPDGTIERALYDDAGTRVVLEHAAKGGRRLALYDLAADPGQEQPVEPGDAEPDRHLVAALDAYERGAAAVVRGPVVVPNGKQLDRLRALGYVQ